MDKATLPDGAAPPAPDREPTVNDIARSLFRDGTVWGALSGLEAGLGLIVHAFFTVVFVSIGGLLALVNAWLYDYPRLDRPTLILLSATWIPLLALEWVSLRFFSDGLLGARRPIPVHVALRQRPDRGALTRAAVGAWWLAHAIVVLLLAHWLADRITFFRPSVGERLLELAAPAALMLGTAFAMNTHLLIALYALTGSEDLVRRFHRLRLVLDVGVAFLLISR